MPDEGKKSPIRRLLPAGAIFLLSIVVRMFIRRDTWFEAPKIQSTVVDLYRIFARFVVEDGFFSLFDAQARVANLDLMEHPPGYSLLLAALFAVFGESNAVIQMVSVFFDALSAVLIFLIAARLFSRRVGVVAGMFAALAPQFALNSVLFLPDTLAIFPLLAAVYCFVRAYQDPSHRNSRFFRLAACGALIGVSCWLRANAMLLPVFFVAAIFSLFEGKHRFRLAGALLGAFVLTIAPIMIRNWVVYRTFIPISLGAGQTMLEGIGDYDAKNRFGIPKTDHGIMRREAEKYNRPDYATALFGEDGIRRDRERLAEGLKIVRENPFWFGKVMIRRAASMTRLERVWLVSTETPVTNSLPAAAAAALWEKSGNDLSRAGNLESGANLAAEETGKFVFTTGGAKDGAQFLSEPLRVRKDMDYFAETSIRLSQGRMAFKAVGDDSGKVYAASVVNFEAGENPSAPPAKSAKLAFVAGRDENVRLGIYNEGENPPATRVEIERIRLIELGATSSTWTKPFRYVVRGLQKLFITGVMLPLAVFGFVLLFYRRQRAEAFILLLIPVYYFAVQSMLHTEYRYVMAIHYFFFTAAAVYLVAAGEYLFGKIRKVIERQPENILF